MMRVLTSLSRPFLLALDPERAHELTLRALELGVYPRDTGASAHDEVLGLSLWGLDFPNPLAVAAGFDKDARVADALLALGCGFGEVGTTTPRPQSGNPAPRVFRLIAERAVINRLGFNNAGHAAARRRLAARSQRGIVGVNIGANKDSADRIADYAAMTRTMAPLATYLTVNISSPNTPGLRALQDEGALAELLDAVIEARGALATPVFLKLAPDLQRADVDAICRIALDRRLDALIVSNTTIERPASLRSVHAGETGGLSGEPLRQMALERLREFRKASGGAIPLIGVGGIASADDAWQRIRAGASLVQIYSAMVYEGPGLARAIVTGLAKRVRQEGMTSIAEAVGTE